MQFGLIEQTCLLSNLNTKPEKHGDEHVPATYLSVRTKVPNTILDSLDPNLRPAFYQKPASAQQDLDPDHLPELKFPLLDPLSYKWKGIGYKGTIAYGATGNDIEMKELKLDRFVLAPLDGGTVQFDFRITCKLDADREGKLAMMQQQEITLSLIPPTADELSEALAKEKSRQKDMLDGDEE